MSIPSPRYLTPTTSASNAIQFRRALVKDANMVHALLRNAYQIPRSIGVTFPASSIPLQKVKQNIGNRKVYLLLLHGLAVGTVSIRKRSFGYEICHLAVDPKYHQRGFGNQLLTFAEQRIRSLGSSFAYLFTAENHPWLPHFYRKRGYELLRISEQNRMPLALYRKRLN